MKRNLLVLSLISLCFSVFGQENTQNFGAAKTAVRIPGRLYVDSIFQLPGLSTFNPLRAGALRYKNGDTVQVWTGAAWASIAGGGGTFALSTINFTGSSTGATYSSGIFKLSKVTATTPGIITTGADTLAGVKTFSNPPIFSGLTSGASTDSIMTVDASGQIHRRSYADVIPTKYWNVNHISGLGGSLTPYGIRSSMLWDSAWNINMQSHDYSRTNVNLDALLADSSFEIVNYKLIGKNTTGIEISEPTGVSLEADYGGSSKAFYVSPTAIKAIGLAPGSGAALKSVVVDTTNGNLYTTALGAGGGSSYYYDIEYNADSTGFILIAGDHSDTIDIGSSAESVASPFPTQQNHTSGSTVTVTSQTTHIWLHSNPSSLLAALTITMPATPVDGQEVEFTGGGTITSGAVITTLTFTPNTGQGILGDTVYTDFSVNDAVKLAWKGSLSKWIHK